MKRFLPDTFILLMIAMVILAVIFPFPAADDSPINLTRIIAIGISLVFFLHGANLEREKLVSSVKKWRVHTLIQGMTFVLFPIIGLIIFFATGELLPDILRLGFFFLAALPSTISSSVALTGVARGNVPVAVFNATLSGLIGMIITPALMGIVSTTTMGGLSIGDAIVDIALTLLAPFVLGQLMRPIIAPILAKHKWILSRFDRGVILMIVYASFASSVLGGVWTQFSIMQFFVTAIIVMILLFAAIAVSIFASRRLNLSTEDEVATVFCGSTKSLANGAPIAQILFAGSPSLGLILLPLMLYHQLQLIVCAMLAQRYAEKQSLVANPAAE
ncbi:bile acid:sodium symporter family protein [Hyphococcus sp. DH-69]|uniref:bile acid:sodium symporter family protein n=1 Tax=Hyphococcus formosus TaxID=3143534 RepID=UPI00398A80FF